MKFVAFERKLQGTGASRRLRVAGKVPGIVFGAGEPTMIELDHNALFHALKKEAFHSSLLEMELAGATTQVLLRDFQMHPYKPQVQHIDFQRVDATTKITKKVPLHFVGEDVSPAVKTDHCTVNHVVTELLITCLAQQLPEGSYLESLRQDGDVVTIRGLAQSFAQVSDLLRNFSSRSQWLERPDLIDSAQVLVPVSPREQKRLQRFEIKVNLKREAASAASGPKAAPASAPAQGK